METESETPKSFAQSYLPWLVAAVALAFYLLNLHRWLTINVLATVPWILGWDWQPNIQSPLYFLVTYPVRWLPEAWRFTSLNVLSVLCATLTLGLLARSVGILPHDRTREQRQLEQNDYSFLSVRLAWLPPVFAVLVCALQFSFWQNAVLATGEALDLLVFAYVTRCLLESRVDERDSWLTRAAFVYGLGVTNNFAMIGFAPLFLVALVWMKGFRFFNTWLVVKMVLWGLAGLSLYFLLPAVHSLSGLTDQSFWQLLRANIGLQKHALFSFQRSNLLFFSPSSLLPVLFIGIRWPAQSGDISATGSILANLMTHVIHAVFLLACLYVAFDPPFSPRHLGAPYQMLPFYYLGALSVGYFAGYFLLLFGRRPVKIWQRPSPIRIGLNYFVLGLVWIAFAVVPVRLWLQNRPEMAEAQNRELARHSELIAASMPKESAVVLSDDLYRLYGVAAVLLSQGQSSKHVLVHTADLAEPAYHRYLARKHGPRWPNLSAGRPGNQRLDDADILQAVVDLSKKEPLWYLHPSYGYYFERFYLKPQNLAYQMLPYATNQVDAPPLSPEEIEQNSAFWKKTMPDLQDLATRMQDLNKPELLNPADMIVAAMYSRALNYLGVEVQRAGPRDQAAEFFRLALRMNTNNPTAYVNHEYNQKLLAGEREYPEPSSEVTKRLVDYQGNWKYILDINGPADEPNICFILGNTFWRGNNFRQSAQQFLRVVHFRPADFNAHAQLAVALIRAGFPQKGLERVEQMRRDFKSANLTVNDQLSLLEAEAWARAKQNDLQTAVTLLQDAQKTYPAESRPYGILAEIYLDAKRMADAMGVFRAQMQRQPDNSLPVINYSALKIRNKEAAEAIDVLSRLLEKEAKNVPARLNRAIAYLLSNRLKEAESDYLIVLRDVSAAFQTGTSGQSALSLHPVYYGLGEIAYQRKDREAAIKYYEDYLQKAPPGTPEAKLVKTRLQILQGGTL